MSDLLTFLRDNSGVPEDDNKPFVLDYTFSDADKSDIRFDFIVSSRKLLGNAIGKKLIAADTTYKIVWQGFPVSPIGTVDQDRHFHLIGMGVSTNEQEEDFTFFFKTIKRKILEISQVEINPTIILCDAAKAISNAFRATFGDDCLVLMCWFHMKKAIKINIGLYFPKEMHELVLKEIDNLHLSRSPEIFQNASQLFKCKLLNWIESWSIEYDSGAKTAYVYEPTITYGLKDTNGRVWRKSYKK